MGNSSVGRVYVSCNCRLDIHILEFETLKHVDRISTDAVSNYRLVISDYLEEEEMNLVVFSEVDVSRGQCHISIHSSLTNERLGKIVNVPGSAGLDILSSSLSDNPIIVSALNTRLCAYNSLTTEKLIDCQNLPFTHIYRIKCFPEWNLNEVFVGGYEGGNGLLERYDLSRDCVQLGSYVGHRGSEYSFGFGITASLTEGILISGSADGISKGTLKLWSKDTFECIESVDLDNRCFSLDYSSDSHLICCGLWNAIEIYDIRNMRRRIRKVSQWGSINDLDLISNLNGINSPLVVSGDSNGYVSIWNPLTGKVLRKTKVGGNIWGIRFLPSLSNQQNQRRRTEEERLNILPTETQQRVEQRERERRIEERRLAQERQAEQDRLRAEERLQQEKEERERIQREEKERRDEAERLRVEAQTRQEERRRRAKELRLAQEANRQAEEEEERIRQHKREKRSQRQEAIRRKEEEERHRRKEQRIAQGRQAEQDRLREAELRAEKDRIRQQEEERFRIQQEEERVEAERLETQEKETQTWQIDPNHIIIDEDDPLGHGAFGTVYKGVFRYNDMFTLPIAIKSIQCSPRCPREDVIREVKFLSRLRHENIVRCYGCYFNGSTAMVVFEICSGGDSFSWMARHPQRLDVTFRVSIIHQIASALLYLHEEAKIAHHDMKPSNILVTVNGVMKVCDFGLSKNLDSATSVGLSGTPMYLPNPTYSGQSGFRVKQDVYSFAITVWELWTGTLAFQSIRSQSFDNPVQCVMAIHLQQLRPEIPPDMPTALGQLLERCWADRPQDRPLMSEVVSVLGRILIGEGVTEPVSSDDDELGGMFGVDEPDGSSRRVDAFPEMTQRRVVEEDGNDGLGLSNSRESFRVMFEADVEEDVALSQKRRVDPVPEMTARHLTQPLPSSSTNEEDNDSLIQFLTTTRLIRYRDSLSSVGLIELSDLELLLEFEDMLEKAIPNPLHRRHFVREAKKVLGAGEGE